MLKWIQGGISAVTGLAEPEYGKDYIHTISDKLTGKQPYRATTRDDFNWLNPDYTNVETATFYFSDLDTGIVGFAQIIHSSIIGFHTAAQFTFRIFDSKNPESLNLWTSTKLDNFRPEGPNFYADNLSIELSEDNTTYHIVSNVNEQSTVDIEVTRLTPGAKAGEDPTTYFGDNIDEPWGSMRHTFWPRNKCVGKINLKKPIKSEETEQEITTEESTEESTEETEPSVAYEDQEIVFTESKPAFSMFVLAFQGMKPHHAAKAWNFVYMHTKTHSAVLMEYITPKSYANTKVSVGIITSDDDVLTLSTTNNYEHLNTEVDEIGWNVPKDIKVSISGVSSKLSDEEIAEKGSEGEKVVAVIEAPLKNLVERVDVMGELPGFVKNIVSGVAGTKPFIYQYASDDFCMQVNNGEKEQGLGWAEVTFISQSDVEPQQDN
ncbi:hypothetical protein KAFR_0E04110 [Kazachstania africana CBS 2517]|uniref:Survival factor 1 n=1 Tax=Kazachstania africana (strain ATCC 22294 / BCRC 22015 / CBS 2517 / CECT 1963 / NBRC 1671 / NRRL Y-8276) TaxID=1071382 RepID=H2AW12_KAZAF|nr:hypothetical protein KAFR_0E04110 [Kazachstania africana CBS 2517]CCF58562.1 hypothetical protein KAFR_0E04110 [Kazachstania africana CBS 2517]